MPCWRGRLGTLGVHDPRPLCLVMLRWEVMVSTLPAVVPKANESARLERRVLVPAWKAMRVSKDSRCCRLIKHHCEIEGSGRDALCCHITTEQLPKIPWQPRYFRARKWTDTIPPPPRGPTGRLHSLSKPLRHAPTAHLKSPATTAPKLLPQLCRHDMQKAAQRLRDTVPHLPIHRLTHRVLVPHESSK